MLSWLRLQLFTGREVRNERHVDVADVLVADVLADLPDRFEERKALDVANGSPDFRDHDIDFVVLSEFADSTLDLVGDVWDDLNSCSEVVAPSLLADHRLVDRPGGHVGVSAEVHAGVALVVAKVEIGLPAIVGHEHLAVFERIHRARIDIDVRIKLLNGDPEPAGLEQSTQGSSSDALAQT